MKNCFEWFHDYRYAIESMENNPITCPVLLVLANANSALRDLFRPQLDVLRKWGNIIIERVNGGHDVHINNPENVVPIISQFLLDKSKNIFEAIQMFIRNNFIYFMAFHISKISEGIISISFLTPS